MKSFRTAVSITVGMMLATSAASFAQARDAGDAVLGHELAREWCAGCHVTEPGRLRSSTDLPPTFEAIAKAPSTDSARLHAFLQRPHSQMPDFTLTRSQINQLVAYILSLRGK